MNRHRKHLLILPEDDANRQLAVGFAKVFADSQIKILPVARDWERVLECFLHEHTHAMLRFTLAVMVLLIDFDGEPGRLNLVKTKIPPDLIDRVFVLGARHEPEDIKDLGTKEQIVELLGNDCWSGTPAAWNHPELSHNAGELNRMREAVHPILFP